MITTIYLGTDKLDLFKDDNILLKSSVAEIQDISKVFTDSTNSFSVPATDNNNRIFKHFANTNLVDGWDVFDKVPAVIEIDGWLHREGKVKLLSVTTKSQKPTSYSIQFYGLLTSLIDILGDDKLSDLDFSAYDFDITSANVISKLCDSWGSPPDVINTTLSTRRMIYDSDAATINTSSIKNIGNNGTGFNSGLEWSFTNTSILNIRIIEVIESAYGITFSRDFFGTNQFNNLYMLLNGGGTENKIEEQIIFDTSTNDPTLENDRILLSTNLPIGEVDYLRISISCQGTNKTDEFTSIIKIGEEEIHSVTANGNNSGLYVYLVKKTDYEVFENLTFHLSSASFLDYRYTVDRYKNTGAGAVLLYKSERDYAEISGFFDVAAKMPDLKVIDYLKGLFKKDKLISISTSETDIYVNSLQQYYREGVVKDITKHIDFSEIPISVGELYSEINYNFKEPKTILAKQFYENTGNYYGDLEFALKDSNGTILDGKSIEVSLPFENMIYEKIYDISGVDTVNFMYGYLADDSLNPVNVTAHLHYAERIDTDNSFKILTGSSSFEIRSQINVPSHTLGFNTPQYSTVFNEEFNEYNGVKISNTIFSNNHSEYISNAFNKNKRLFKYKAKDLPVDFLLNLKLNDVLEIKDEYYRINKYNLNLITKECDFELYNITDLNLTPTESVTWDSSEITWDSTEITFDRT